jgi:predicted nucleic acid-binding protein
MIVFDTSTLILMAKTEILDSFLLNVGLEVAIPSAVERECCNAKTSLDSLMIRKALNESRIGVIAARDGKLVAKVQGDFGLGRGEAEAIVWRSWRRHGFWALMTRMESMRASYSGFRSPRR